MTWRLEAGTYDLLRMDATAWGTGATKRVMSRPHSSSQEATEDSGRLSIQERGTLVRAIGSQFAITLSPPPTQMAYPYNRKNSSGSALSSYRGGNAGLNLCGHRTRRRLGVKARWPAAPL